MILLLALALTGGPPIELANGPFMAEGKQTVYYQVLGVSGLVHVDKVNEDPEFQIRFIYRNKGKFADVGTAGNIRFPIRTIHLNWFAIKTKSRRSSLLIVDSNSRFWMVHCIEGVWTLETNPMTFFIAITKWLSN